MLKKLVLAVVPMMFVAAVAVAEDDFLADLDVSNIQDADISIEEATFDVDFDDLANNAGEETEAIEACFRRFGYGYGFGYGYRWGGYGYRWGGCYRPYFYGCYRPVYHHCYYPVYRNYWGCW